MTTTLTQLENWMALEEAKVIGIFKSEEAQVIEWAKPLIAQIVASVEALGKTTFTEGLQVLKDAAEAAVQAGAATLATGNLEAVGAAATAAFIATGASEGLTVVKNAEAGAIKIAVAAAQQGVATIAETPAADEPVETPAT